MFNKLMKNVNIKRMWIAILVVFVYIFISDFLIHGVILAQTYKETASLWRPEQEMHTYMLWMLLGQFLVAKFFTALYARGSEGKGGMAEGFRFSLLVAPLMVAPCFIQYAVTPIPRSLLFAWVGLGLLQAFGAGLVAGAVYKR